MPAAVLRLSDRKSGLACGIVTRQSRQLLVEPVRGAAPLVPEDEAVAVLEPRVPEPALGLGREEPEPPWGGVARAERRPVRVLVHVEGEPVVHARAPQVAVGDLEAQRMDQVQARPRERAHPAHVARVLGDLGLEEDDVDHLGSGCPAPILFLPAPLVNASSLRVAFCPSGRNALAEPAPP